MRRGVQECVRNWVGRPIQEHRPNFQFVCKIFHIRIIKNGELFIISISRPFKNWVWRVTISGDGYYAYNDALVRYREDHCRGIIIKITMKSNQLSYRFEANKHLCSIMRGPGLRYSLSFTEEQLLVRVTTEPAERTKVYRIGLKGAEESRQLARRVIKQLDRHMGV